MKNRFLLYGGAALLALFIAGCGGDDGKDGAQGPPGTVDPADVEAAVQTALASEQALQAANPEQCALCHTGDDSVARTGPDHQAIYKEAYQDGAIVVSNLAITTNGVDTTTLTFNMTKNGAPFDCRKSTADFTIGGYFKPYDSATRTFTYPEPGLGLSLVPAASGKSYNGTGGCTFTKTFTDATDKAAVAGLATSNGIVTLYGVDEIIERITDAGKRLTIGKYPFAAVLKVGTVDYVSAANVSGCENCHTQPYLKHAYIYGQVDDGTGAKGLDFYVCKGCHSDNRSGGHEDWQILKDDPARYVEITAPGGQTTPEEDAKYAYKTKLMNDVHMSHNMEFAYPQRMSNCVTCHEGKLNVVLADDKFKAETCISCHSIDDPSNSSDSAPLRGLGLRTMMSAASFPHGSYTADLATLRSTDCTICHKQVGGAAPGLGTFHNGGYDPRIYTATGVRYSDTFKVTIDTASLGADNKLTFTFKATESPDIAGLGVADIVPTVLIGLYGYDSKDFIVAAHGRDADRNRLLEFEVGVDTNPRFTGSVVGTGSWTVTADLSLWADKLADGTIKRAEIAVLPGLTDANGLVLGLDAPSRTFNLATNAFEDNFMRYGGQFTTDNLVKVAKTVGADGVTGCNTCHDQLATTFHSGDRGGNIRVCRICHEVSNAASHLELQSRSIDSYIHGIHSFQAFDPGDIDVNDPVEWLQYEHHTNTEFPRFGVLNCESCHYANRYNVPNQARSMPGVLSGTDTVEGRNIGSIDPSVTGPAVRACGGCHRAQKINADDPGALATVIQHFKTFGYVVDAPDSATRGSLWESIVAKIMGLFKS
jgi:OmcA/MtrC family decaheme c-type cytochrome